MFIKDLFSGLFAFGKAHRVIFEHKYWSFLILPGILSSLYVILLIVLGYIYFPGVSGYINQNWMPGFLSGNVMATITAIFLWLVLIFLLYMTYKHVILILLAPILSHLSERTENDVYNRPSPPFSAAQMVKDIWRGLVLNLRNLFLSLILTLLAWLLVFIPVVGAVVSMVLIILIQSYYGGFSLMDYTLERRRYSVSESIEFSKNHRSLATGLGGGFMLLALIPIVGWFTAPTYGTVAATLAALEKMEREASGTE